MLILALLKESFYTITRECAITQWHNNARREGKTNEEATEIAQIARSKRVAEAAIGGAISGFLMGGGQMTLNALLNSNYNRQVLDGLRSPEKINELISDGLRRTTDSRAYKQAQQLQQRYKAETEKQQRKGLNLEQAQAKAAQLIKLNDMRYIVVENARTEARSYLEGARVHRSAIQGIDNIICGRGLTQEQAVQIAAEPKAMEVLNTLIGRQVKPNAKNIIGAANYLIDKTNVLRKRLTRIDDAPLNEHWASSIIRENQAANQEVSGNEQ